MMRQNFGPIIGCRVQRKEEESKELTPNKNKTNKPKRHQWSIDEKESSKAKN